MTKCLELIEISRNGVISMAVMFPLGSEIRRLGLYKRTSHLQALDLMPFLPNRRGSDEIMYYIADR